MLSTATMLVWVASAPAPEAVTTFLVMGSTKRVGRKLPSPPTQDLRFSSLMHVKKSIRA